MDTVAAGRCTQSGDRFEVLGDMSDTESAFEELHDTDIPMQELPDSRDLRLARVGRRLRLWNLEPNLALVVRVAANLFGMPVRQLSWRASRRSRCAPLVAYWATLVVALRGLAIIKSPLLYASKVFRARPASHLGLDASLATPVTEVQVGRSRSRQPCYLLSFRCLLG